MSGLNQWMSIDIETFMINFICLNGNSLRFIQEDKKGDLF